MYKNRNKYSGRERRGRLDNIVADWPGKPVRCQWRCKTPHKWRLKSAPLGPGFQAWHVP